MRTTRGSQAVNHSSIMGQQLFANSSRSAYQSHKSGEGFSLLEALVALVVLSLGVLGVAAIQTSALKFTQVSQQRAIASQYVMSMSDRMRSNLAGVRGASYALSDNTYAGVPGAKPAAVSCSGSCSSAQIAQRDLNLWLTELNTALPGGRGIITGTSVNAFQITVMWEEKDLTAGLKAACPAVAAAPTQVQCISADFQP